MYLIGLNNLNMQGGEGWEESSHLYSELPTRWTHIVLGNKLHSLWAQADDVLVQDPYESRYFSIYHSASVDGKLWENPNDVIYDDFGITGFQVLASEDRVHLFWLSDCIHQAFIFKDFGIF